LEGHWTTLAAQDNCDWLKEIQTSRAVFSLTSEMLVVAAKLHSRAVEKGPALCDKSRLHGLKKGRVISPN